MLAPELAALKGLKDRDLLATGLVVAEGRLLALRLLEAAARTRSSGALGDPSRGLDTLPQPRFEALALACVPSLASELGPRAAGPLPPPRPPRGRACGACGLSLPPRCPGPGAPPSRIGLRLRTSPAYRPLPPPHPPCHNRPRKSRRHAEDSGRPGLWGRPGGPGHLRPPVPAEPSGCPWGLP